jgi:hypothetical protein
MLVCSKCNGILKSLMTRPTCESPELCPNMPPWGFLANLACSETPALVVSEALCPQKTLALEKRPGIVGIEPLFGLKCHRLYTAASIHQHFWSCNCEEVAMTTEQPKPRKLLDRVRDMLRVKHHSIRAEKACIKRSPKQKAGVHYPGLFFRLRKSATCSGSARSPRTGCPALAGIW